MRRPKFAALVLMALFVGTDAHAFAILQSYNAYGIYNADTNVFNMSTAGRYGLALFNDPQQPEYNRYDFSGAHTFVFAISEDGTFGTGVFTLFGTVTDLGIDTPTLLVAGVVNGGAASVGPPLRCGVDVVAWEGCPEGTEQGRVHFGIDLQTIDVHPMLRPYWQSQMSVFFNASMFTKSCGSRVPFPSSPLNNETLFQYSWDGCEYDYWFLTTGGNSLPAPGTLALLSLGLLSLGFTARRRLH